MKKYIKTNASLYKVFSKPHGILIWKVPFDYWIMYKGNAIFTEYNLTLTI